MSQLMLLGPASGSAPVSTELSVKYREELLESIKKIVEKPISIKNETVHVNYSVSKGLDDHQLAASLDRAGVSTSFPRKSYLQEYDETLRLKNAGQVVS